MTAIDETTRRALLDLKARLARLYGPRFRALYLYGSRARGDHRPDSDADVAVVLDPVRDCWADERLADDPSYDVLLEHGIVVHPRVLDRSSLDDPDSFPDPHLTRGVLRDGIAL